jgi:hypothetical protein
VDLERQSHASGLLAVRLTAAERMEATSLRYRAIIAIAIAAASAVVIVALALAAEARSGGEIRLRPDLTIIRPHHARLEQSDKGVLRIRFDNTVANQGTGPLEIFPEEGPVAECNPEGAPEEGRYAGQRVFLDNPQADSTGYFERDDDSAFDEERVGCMRFHPQHSHWHLEDFARYELRRLAHGDLVGASNKVGFCLLDGLTPSGTLPGAPRSGYYPDDPENPDLRNCSQTSTNGISIGWADVYTSPLQGQSIKVSGIRRGNYCLLSAVDPENRLEELDDDNNERGTPLRILPRKLRVTRLDGSCS